MRQRSPRISIACWRRVAAAADPLLRSRLSSSAHSPPPASPTSSQSVVLPHRCRPRRWMAPSWSCLPAVFPAGGGSTAWGGRRSRSKEGIWRADQSSSSAILINYKSIPCLAPKPRSRPQKIPITVQSQLRGLGFRNDSPLGLD